MTDAKKHEWGIPDWRDESAYPGPDDLSMDEWRWQFLRRREDYRQDWLKHADSTYRYYLARSRDSNDQIYYGKEICTPNHPQFMAEYRGPRKYGLIGLPNPAIEKPWFASITPHGHEGSYVEGRGPGWLGSGELTEIDLPEGFAAYTFDLRKPIPPQIKKAKNDLRDLQKHRRGKIEQRRRHQKKWPLYLRLLDAREIGEAWETIAYALLLDVETIGDLPIEEYDRLVEKGGSIAAAKAYQVWEAARELMFNFPD